MKKAGVKWRSDIAESGEVEDEYSWLLLNRADIPRTINHNGSISSCFAYFCNPRYRSYRYIIAVLLSLIEGVISYCTDMPAGIQSTLTQVMKIDSTEYNLMFSASKWPDVVMSFAGCVIVNRYLGIHLGLVFFSFLVLVGQLMCSLGAYLNTYWVLMVGRIVLGSGTGTTLSILSSFQILWFATGKEITFIMSLSRCVCRLMAMLALNTPQLIYDALDSAIVSRYTRLGTTMMFGSALCVTGVGFAVAIFLLDKHGAGANGRKLPFIKKQTSILDIKKFPISFWAIVLICSVFYSVIFSFTANGQIFFVSKYGLSVVTANFANSLSYASIVAFTPFIALLMAMLGCNLVWGLLGIILAITSSVVCVVSSDSDVVPFIAAVIYSFACTFFSSPMWIAPGLTVPKHYVTTAYSMVMSLLALVTSVVGLLAGVIIDHFGYQMLGVFYLLLLCSIAMLITVLALFEHQSNKRVLNASGNAR